MDVFNKPAITQEPEGAFSKSDLYRAAKMAIKLFKLIDDNEQLETWIQVKIAKSADYLDAVLHYLEYQSKFGIQGTHGIQHVDELTGDLEVPELAESTVYERSLQSLLESAKKKSANVSEVKKTKKMPSKSCQMEAKKKPSAGMTKKEKSSVTKQARAGKDIGKPGKKFGEVASKAAKQYGSKEKGEKVAAAAMWKAQAKKGK